MNIIPISLLAFSATLLSLCVFSAEKASATKTEDRPVKIVVVSLLFNSFFSNKGNLPMRNKTVSVLAIAAATLSFFVFSANKDQTAKKEDSPAVNSSEQRTLGNELDQIFIDNIPAPTPILELSTTTESACSSKETFQPSIGEYFAGDTSKLESEYFDWLSAATDGNEWAQCRMGDFWFTGAAGYSNHCEALKWWLASAEQGNVVAKYRLIKYYFLTSFEEWCRPHPFLHGLLF